MNESKKKLLKRIKKLEEWQKEMIIIDFLYDAGEKQEKGIEKEVKMYEKLNEEVEEEFGQKNNPRSNVSHLST